MTVQARLDSTVDQLCKGRAMQLALLTCPTRASAAGTAASPELVSNETKPDSRPDRIEINTHAKRVKRMSTAVHHSARLLDFDAGEGGRRTRKAFITLTYKDVDGWEPGDIRAFTDKLRGWCKRRHIPLRFVWVAELQKRGAVHYHVCVWIPHNKKLPKPDQAGWWGGGYTDIREIKNPAAYMAKYASKTTPDDAARYPKGARMHGAGGLAKEGKRHLRYWQAPFWVRDGLGGRADIRKVTGGYADKITGEFLPSPWMVVLDGGKVWAIKKPENEPMRMH
ncbi:MAG: replication initiation protein [Lysobacteraceae bacterium]